MHESILTYSDASHEDDTFKKTPLQWAVENHDIFSLIELETYYNFLYLDFHFVNIFLQI